ncbi:MAG: winged helix-turn-helix transcriptional regulator [Elainellaceae cyanobacterium]
MDTSYAQFCPIAKAAEIIAQPWMPLVIRELLCGSCRFNDLHRGVPKMSRSLLVRRLEQLEQSGLIERRLVGNDAHPEYHLTQAGEAIRPIMIQLGDWGKQWVQHEISQHDLDAGLLMWDIQRRIERSQLPPHRVVVLFQFKDAPEEHQQFWLLLTPDVVDLCLKDPGYDVDLYVCSDIRTFTEVWLGDQDLAQALKDDSIWLLGPTELQKQFPSWLSLNVFANVKR